jgi:hypothetical protein
MNDPSRSHSAGPAVPLGIGPCRVCSKCIDLVDFTTRSGRAMHKACAATQEARSAGQPHQVRKEEP